MWSISLRLALRYLRPRRSFLSVVNVLCVCGILLGVGTLIVVIAVMSGFDRMWKERLLVFTPHILIHGKHRQVLPEEGPLYEILRSVPGVNRVEGFVEGLLILEHREIFEPPFLRGIAADRPNFLTDDPKVIREGRYSLEEGDILLGVDLAARLRVQPGREVSAFMPQSFVGEDTLRLPASLYVTGIFEVGMWQIDQYFAITSLATGRDLLGIEEGVQGIQLTLENPAGAWPVALDIQQRIGPEYLISTWMESNQQLFGALQVEKRMMFFLLAIISVVASFIVMSTLITITVEKTREIGLMRSVGFTRAQIQRIFLWYGIIQGVTGAILGTVVGLLVVHYRNTIMDGVARLSGFEIFPKELYFLSELPAQVLVADVVSINGVVLIMCLVAGFVPATLAARRHPVESLRHE